MPVATCKCGLLTNSATSDYWEQVRVVARKSGYSSQPVVPTKCYAGMKDGEWIEGCAFDRADDLQKKFALDIIARGSKTKSGK